MVKVRRMTKWAVMPAVTWLSFVFFLLFPARSYSVGQPDLLCFMHNNSPLGPRIDCTYCHDNPDLGILKNNADLTGATLCDQCHSPAGQFDGVNDPIIGAKANWQTGVYDEQGNLKKGQEKWCVSCHDDGDCTILGVPAPNVAGLSVSSSHWDSPAALFSSKVAGADRLIDHDAETGTTGGEMIFDLGHPAYVSQVRIYTVAATTETANWELWGGNDGVSWTRVLFGRSVLFSAPTWKTNSSAGWNEIRLDKFISVRYLKLVKVSSWPLNKSYLREFEFKQDIQYGYYASGHKIRCEYCHNAASPHIDAFAQTYRASQNNYRTGYRLKSVQVDAGIVPPLEIPRVGCNNGENPRVGNDFALCFTCHDKYKLLGDADGTGDFKKYPLETNFRNDSHKDTQGHVSNEHLRHLRGRQACGNGKDWDSDWDGAVDSPQSCPACHNVHGSPNPAMTRHGELAGTPGASDRAPMLNFQYLNAAGEVDPGILNASSSFGGQTQFWGSGPGTVARNRICNMCHNDQITYSRAPSSSPIAECRSCHTNMSDTVAYGPSHATHLVTDPRGPTVACTGCHSDTSSGSPHLRLFSDGQPLAGTTACDPCHSKDGTFDGIHDLLIGAKVNWPDGVYQKPQRVDLKAGLEDWCAGCHDSGTSLCSAVSAPNVMGDNATYGYNINGHKMACSACHDLTVNHIDGDARTYSHLHKSDPSNMADPHIYQNGYRLKVGMTIPLSTGPGGGSGIERFALCFRVGCHNYDTIMDPASSETNFSDDGINRHWSHVTSGLAAWDSDWDYLQTTDNSLDSRMSCPACHNVHGSPNPAMIRHGELISTPGTQDKVAALSFRYYKDDGYTITIFGQESRYGDMPVLGGPGNGSLQDNKVCIGCHGGPNPIRYDRDGPYQTPQLPDASQWAQPPLPPSMRLLNPAPASQGIEVDHEVSFILLSNGKDDIDWNRFSVSLQGTISQTQVYERYDSGIDIESIAVRPQGYRVTISPLISFSGQEKVTVTVGASDSAGHRLTSPSWCFETGLSSPLIWRSPKAVLTESNLWYADLMIDSNPETGNSYLPFPEHWVIYDLGKSYHLSQVRFLISCPEGRSWNISVSDDPDPYDFGAAVKTNWNAEPGSITVDNTQAAFSPASSSWPTVSTVPGYYGTDYQTYAAVFGDTTATCTWTPQIPADGKYLVYARWTSGLDRTKTAAYTIRHDGGSDTVSMNQQIDGGKWNLLGTYSFVQGNSGSIVLSNACSDAASEGLFVVADAIRLVLPQWVNTSFDPKQGRYLKLWTSRGPLSKDTIREVNFAE